MIREHDRIVLTADLPDDGLKAGDVGTVIHIYRDATGYEVEFFRLDGKTAAVATVAASHVRPITPNDVLHTRSLVSA